MCTTKTDLRSEMMAELIEDHKKALEMTVQSAHLMMKYNPILHWLLCAAAKIITERLSRKSET